MAGKNYKSALELIDRNKVYTPTEAIDLLKKTAKAKFDETIELHLRLGIDPKKADQQVRGAVSLPHGTGKEVKVIVFAKGEKAKEAKDCGADLVGAEDLAEKVEKGWMDFDVAIATPDIMSLVGRLGKILGPQGLMPNPKAGTVTFNIGKAVGDVKAGKVEYRTDKAGIIHLTIGKKSFLEKDLLDNYIAVMEEIIKAKPSAAKGRYLRSISVSSTMGPGIKIDPLKPTG